MSVSLHNLKGSIKKTKRRPGRGHGSGLGTTAGRGQKGQKARSGVGGLKRLGMRKLLLATPKLRGFQSPHGKKATVKLEVIATSFAANEMVSPRSLRKKGLIASEREGVKIIGNGTLSVPLKVQGCVLSSAAAKAVTDAGGIIVE